MAFGSLEAGGALSGAASGATAGATFGPWGAAIGGVLGGLGGFLGSSSSAKAQKNAQAAAQAAAAARAEQLQKGLSVQQQAGQQSLGYLQPYVGAGSDATKLLGGYLGTQGRDVQQGLFSDFNNDPGYQASLKAGTDAITGTAAANGLLRSGGALKSLFAFGQQQQQAQYQDRMNRLYQMAGLGLPAASASGQLTQQNANAQSGIYKDLGDTAAAGILGPAAIGTQSAQQGANGLMQGIGMLPSLANAMKTPINNVAGYLGNFQMPSFAGA